MMTAKIKLTNSDGTTDGCAKGALTRWKVGATVTATGESTALCTSGVLHYYEAETNEEALLLGLMANQLHGNIKAPRAFVVTGETVACDGIKSGAKVLTVREKIAIPQVKTDARVRFAILCALLRRAGLPATWVTWAEGWMNGTNRSSACAAEAADAAWAAEATEAARATWAAEAADAAEAAAWAASAAVGAARTVSDFDAVEFSCLLGKLAARAVREEAQL